MPSYKNNYKGQPLERKDYDGFFRIYRREQHTTKDFEGFAIGCREAIGAYAAANPGFWHGDPFRGARSLIEMEINANPQYVDWPIYIIRITREGAQGYCVNRRNRTS